MANSLKFGTSGLRGLATDLVGIESRRYAAAFVSHLRKGGWAGTDMLVGRDLRASSPAIAGDVMAALAASGIRAIDAGEVPTPALALAALARQLPALMVTGSHIPGDRNGLKFYLPTGEIGKDDEAGIGAALGAGTGAEPNALSDPSVLDAYRKRYGGFAARDALAGLRIGVWQHSSVARDLLVEVLDGFGVVTLPLGRSETFVPVDTEAVSSAAAAELAAWTVAHRLDAVVSTDGDADRPLLVDETGAVLRGDVLGLLTAQFLGADWVMTPVTSISTVEAAGGWRATRTRVGSPFVVAAMAEAVRASAKLVVGFEANGGVLLGSDAEVNGQRLTALPTRDALLPILAVLTAAQARGATLSQLVATLPARFSRSDRLADVAAERIALLLARLAGDAAGFLEAQGAIAARSAIDGLRFELSSGEIIHYRASGNAPELRCYTEAATPDRAEALLAWGLAAAAAVVR